MKLKGWIFAVAFILLGSYVYADGGIIVTYNNTPISFTEEPIIRNDKTLVQLRPIAEAMGLEIGYINETGEVVLSAGDTKVIFIAESDIIKINGVEQKMIAPAINYHDYTFVPARDLAEPFGKAVGYDSNTKAVSISDQSTTVEQGSQKSEQATNKEDKKALYEIFHIPSGSGKYEWYFYYQSQPELPFDNNGRGFCWVCSYAMLISNVTGTDVTPVAVANVNLENGLGASTAYHTQIMRKFGCEFVPALTEDSPYFAGYNTLGKGDTTIKFEDEAGLIAALKDMLDRFPDGVLVRYECYPHTMLAVGYEGDVIYFNDPAMSSAEHVSFDKTCLKKYSLTDITFVQAIRKIEGK